MKTAFQALDRHFCFCIGLHLLILKNDQFWDVRRNYAHLKILSLYQDTPRFHLVKIHLKYIKYISCLCCNINIFYKYFFPFTDIYRYRISNFKCKTLTSYCVESITFFYISLNVLKSFYCQHLAYQSHQRILQNFIQFL